MEDAMSRKPERMTLADLLTGESLEVQFNPEQLPEEVTVNWTRLSVPGNSHQQLQYGNTNNHTYSLDIFFEAHSEEELERIAEARNFLLSLCYPSGNAGDVATGGPPRVLFVWPNITTFTAHVARVRIVHQRFTLYGESSRYLATVEIEEVRDGRLTSEAVRAIGTRRGVGG